MIALKTIWMRLPAPFRAVAAGLGATVAGVVEETSFRGSIEGGIERRHGMTIAILVTGILFGLSHLPHPEVGIVLIPFYIAVAAVYGLSAAGRRRPDPAHNTLTSEAWGVTMTVDSNAMESSADEPRPIPGMWGVRYQVGDVQRSILFYTQTLGFTLDMNNPPAFGQVSIGHLKLILSGPGASGSRPMPDGRRQEPGGWNRVVLQVNDLAALVGELGSRGVRFRNEIEAGPGGRQIQLEDPDGNPVELFEPAPR